MREIVLDTETTGINPRDGHRIIEIGALELMHHLPTGKELHIYINPERDIDDGAVAVHGLTSLFLSDKPVFAEIVDEFLLFIGEAPLVIHNASFDLGFKNPVFSEQRRRGAWERKSRPVRNVSGVQFHEDSRSDYNRLLSCIQNYRK